MSALLGDSGRVVNSFDPEIGPEVTLRPLATSCAKDYKGHSLVQTSFTETPNTLHTLLRPNENALNENNTATQASHTFDEVSGSLPRNGENSFGIDGSPGVDGV